MYSTLRCLSTETPCLPTGGLPLSLQKERGGQEPLKPSSQEFKGNVPLDSNITFVSIMITHSLETF
jgi:hypothetical protein